MKTPFPKHYNEPMYCEFPIPQHAARESKPIEKSKWLDQEVIYVSESGREWPATVTAAFENGYKVPNGETLPQLCLEFRNERSKLIRKHRVLPWGWAYWTHNSNYCGVWKPKTTPGTTVSAPART